MGFVSSLLSFLGLGNCEIVPTTKGVEIERCLLPRRSVVVGDGVVDADVDDDFDEDLPPPPPRSAAFQNLLDSRPNSEVVTHISLESEGGSGNGYVAHLRLEQGRSGNRATPGAERLMMTGDRFGSSTSHVSGTVYRVGIIMGDVVPPGDLFLANIEELASRWGLSSPPTEIARIFTRRFTAEWFVDRGIKQLVVMHDTLGGRNQFVLRIDEDEGVIVLDVSSDEHWPTGTGFAFLDLVNSW